MRELKEGSITVPTTVAGRPATLTVRAGERISERRYKALSDEEQKRFKLVRKSSAPDTSSASDDAPATQTEN